MLKLAPCESIPKRDKIESKFWFINAGLLSPSRYQKAVIEASTANFDIDELHFILFLGIKYLVHYIELFTFDNTPLMVIVILNHIKYLKLLVGAQKRETHKLISYQLFAKLENIFIKVSQEKSSEFVHCQLYIDQLEKFCHLFGARLSVWLKSSKLQAYLFNYGFDPYTTCCFYNSFLFPNETKFVNPMVLFNQRILDKIELKCHCKIFIVSESSRSNIVPSHLTLEVLFDIYKGNYTGFLNMFSSILRYVHRNVYSMKPVRTIVLEGSCFYNIMSNLPVQRLKYLEKHVKEGFPIEPFLSKNSFSKNFFSVLGLLRDNDKNTALTRVENQKKMMKDLEIDDDDNSDSVQTINLGSPSYYDRYATEEELLQIYNCSDVVNYSLKVLKYFEMKYANQVQQFQCDRFQRCNTAQMNGFDNTDSNATDITTSRRSLQAIKKSVNVSNIHGDVVKCDSESATKMTSTITNSDIYDDNKQLLEVGNTVKQNMTWISQEATQLLLSNHNTRFNARLKRPVRSKSMWVESKRSIDNALQKAGGEYLLRIFNKLNFYKYKEWTDFIQMSIKFRFHKVPNYNENIWQHLGRTNNSQTTVVASNCTSNHKLRNFFDLFRLINNEETCSNSQFRKLWNGIGVDLKLLPQINSKLIKYPAKLGFIQLLTKSTIDGNKNKLYTLSKLLSIISYDLRLIVQTRHEDMIFILSHHFNELKSLFNGSYIENEIKTSMALLNIMNKLEKVVQFFEKKNNLYYHYTNVLANEIIIYHYIIFRKPIGLLEFPCHFGVKIVYHSIILNLDVGAIEPFLKLPNDNRISKIEEMCHCKTARRVQKHYVTKNTEIIIDVFYNFADGDHFRFINELNSLYSADSPQTADSAFKSNRSLIIFPHGEIWTFSNVQCLKTMFKLNPNSNDLL